MEPDHGERIPHQTLCVLQSPHLLLLTAKVAEATDIRATEGGVVAGTQLAEQYSGTFECTVHGRYSKPQNRKDDAPV